MSLGLAPTYPIDSSHEDTPGYMGALTQSTEQFGRAVNGNTPAKGADNELSDARILARAREAHEQGKTFIETNIAAAWDRSYNAYRNKHFAGSKYHSAEFKGRSKLFRPKTMAAVRKQLMAATQALFTSADVLSIEAQDDSNKIQRASADLKQKLINYRLSRKSGRNGLRWFQQAIGARFNSTVAGLVISKQSWMYQEDEDGNKLVDRPDICIFEPENVILDPNAHWIDPARTGSYVILRYPSTAEDAMAMIEQYTGVPWIDNIDISLLQSRGQKTTGEVSTNTAQARQGGTNPKDDAHGTFKTVWLHENFMRIKGREYVFWTLGKDLLLSKPQRLKDAYPHLSGDRPVVVGYSVIEPHKVYPMSPVESWQPLQQEANDITNLRLDHMKTLVNRPTFVKRGAKVDLQQVQRRGPGAIVLVQSQEDVQPEEVPDVPQSAYVETNYINADFDDLAGGFSTGSVQTNRSLNETVGGMKLLANDSNNIMEFDLTVFVETWIEPVLWQLVKLEEFYENDETILAICGRQAGILDRFGINEITTGLLRSETTLTVNVGVGSATSPQEKVNRFFAAAEGAGRLLAPFWQQGILPPLIPKQREIIDTVFGGAGYHEASSRFFHPGDDDKEFAQKQSQEQAGPQQPPPDPEKMAKAQAIAQKSQMDAGIAMQKEQREAERHRLEMSIKQQQAEMERLRGMIEMARSQQDAQAETAFREQESALSAFIATQEAMLSQQIASDKAAAQVEQTRARTEQITSAPKKPESKKPEAKAEAAPAPAAAPAQDSAVTKKLVQTLDKIAAKLTEKPEPKPEPKGDDAGERRANKELIAALTAITGAMKQTNEAVAQTAQANAEALEKIGATVGEVRDHQRAPGELVKDASGRVVGARKGNVEYDVKTDANGRISKFAPKARG